MVGLLTPAVSGDWIARTNPSPPPHLLTARCLTISCPTLSAVGWALNTNGEPSRMAHNPPRNKLESQSRSSRSSDTTAIPSVGKILRYLAPVAIVLTILYRSFFKELTNTYSTLSVARNVNMTVADSLTPASWRQQLDRLPVGGRIPAFFFAHGCTFLSATQADDSAIVDLAGTVIVAHAPRCNWRSEGSACSIFERFREDVVGEV